MRFFPDKVWSLTIAISLIMIATANINVVTAGGDPTIKDKNITAL